MRRRHALLALVLLALPSIAAAQATVAGTLDRVDAARGVVAIRTREGATREGRLSAQTLVTIDGFPGALRDLRPGQSVSAQFAVTQQGATRAELVRLDARTR